MEQLKQLNNIFKGDKIIWMIFFLLCIISVVEVYSSSSILGYKTGNYWYAAFYHTFLLLVGLACMVMVLNVPCRFFKVVTPVLVPLSFFLLIAVLFFGTKANDAARWIKIGFIPLQPSEIAKGAMVLATAHILSQLQTPTGANPKATRYILYTAVFLIVPIFPENFSTAALLSAVVFMMMVIGRVPMKHIGYIISGAVFIVVVVLIMILSFGESKKAETLDENGKQLTEMVEGKQQKVVVEDASASRRPAFLHRFDLWRQRIDKFLDKEYVEPKHYDLDKNGQVGHANIAIARSNFIGRGPGNSEQRDFLPLAFSDFIYAIIFEELGWLGAAFVALLYISLLFRTGYIARRCQNNFPAYLAIGLALLMVTQALFNMCVAVGLAPVTGQPLPLISKGGTSSIINCVYIGVILSISRTAKVRSEAADSTVEVKSKK